MQQLLTILVIFLTWPGRLLADPTASTGRAELQSAYVAELKDNVSIFASAPIYHIIPRANTITFAGDYRNYDVTVAPAGVAIGSDTSELTERLEMTGWSASPYVAFQAKHFGFGFAGETGERSVHYLRKADATGGYEEHLGEAKYSGVGLSLFWTPGWKFLPKFAAPTIIVGAKTLNVVEKSSGELLEQFSAVEMAKYQYSVRNFEAGCNVSLKFVKRFTIIPWVDFSSYHADTPKSSDGSDATDPAVADDALLFWRSAPVLTYGIDFAARVWGFEIHMGGLLGVLGTLNKGSDRIRDSSRAISISFDTRGD